MPQPRINYLLDRYLSQQATPDEINELLQLSANTSAEEAVKAALAQSWSQFSTRDEMPAEQANGIFNSIIQEAAGLHRPPAKLVRMRILKRVAVAAVFVLLAGVGIYYFTLRNTSEPVTPTLATIMPPASANAILTLANGQQIRLDSAGNGILAMQGNAKVEKLSDGQITYNSQPASNNAPLPAEALAKAGLTYNTLTVPRGSKVVSIVLADGSKVWLNSESSIKYPAAFTGNERSVEMTGEAYFEVAKDPSKKFIVNSNGVRTEVLGTHFNVNAYHDEGETKVTLLEGSVRVGNQQSAYAKASADKSAILKPGEQAVITTNNKLQTTNNIDVDAVVAWKNGRFEFSAQTIEPIMQQVARWYDVQVEYRGAKPTDNFMGGTSRQANVSELLKILEQTKAIRFQIDGKKIIVMKP